MKYKKIHQEVELLCEGKGTLLYLIKFGSHLYGTNTENSDTDYKGIFLPHAKNLILEHKCRSITQHTASDNAKNISDDVDIDLWSLQHWLDLLKKGDTNAIDMLFSYTNKDVLIYVSPMFAKIFENPMNYINLRDNTAYIAYAYHQAKKYGLKGTRLHLLKSIYDYVNNALNENKICEQDQFKVLIPDIKNLFFNEKLCFDKVDNQGANILYILGSGFHEKIKVSEVITRLKVSYTKYGTRAILAEKNENVDWKAISHAMRCIFQIKKLAQSGHLVFPLSEADYLMKIKTGKFSWKECEKNIADGLAELETLVNELPQNSLINQVHEKTILSFYPQIST